VAITGKNFTRSCRGVMKTLKRCSPEVTEENDENKLRIADKPAEIIMPCDLVRSNKYDYIKFDILRTAQRHIFL